MYNFKEKAVIVAELMQSLYAEQDLELLISYSPSSRQAHRHGSAASRHEAILHELLDLTTRESILEARELSAEAAAKGEGEKKPAKADKASEDTGKLQEAIDELGERIDEETSTLHEKVDELAEELESEKKSEAEPTKARKKSTP